MSEVPEIEEYVTSDGWSLKCMAINCNWTDFAAERTENWMEEMHESMDQHEAFHKGEI